MRWAQKNRGQPQQNWCWPRCESERRSDRSFQPFAAAKPDLATCRDGHGFTSHWVAANAGRTLTDFESSEARQCHSSVIPETIGNTIEDSVHEA